MYESRHLRRIFLGTAASVAKLFDAAADKAIAQGFATGSAREIAHSQVRFDFDPDASRAVEVDYRLAVEGRDWSVHQRAIAQGATMNTALARAPRGNVIESVIAKGDLSQLTPTERSAYYTQLCHSLGMNPHTQPFQYLTLQGKLSLYATRGAADQLRKINGVSIEIVEQKLSNDLLIIRVRATDKDGRTDEDFGAVPFPDTLKGEQRSNTILKAITKAKRRVTLSICGLGFLDETEAADIPGARHVPLAQVSAPDTSFDAETGEVFEDDEEPTVEIAKYEAILTEAAKGGADALRAAWATVPKHYREVLKAMKDQLKDAAAAGHEAVTEPATPAAPF
jgi:hypothetical protein